MSHRNKKTSLILAAFAVLTFNACNDSKNNNTNTNVNLDSLETPVVTQVDEPSDTITPETCLEALGYGEITLDNGQVWLDRNLGASEVANGDLNNSLAFGDYYQWGRGNDGHEKSDSNINDTLATQTAPLENSAWEGKWIYNENSDDDWVESNIDINGTERALAWNTSRPDFTDESMPLAQVCPCGFVVPSARDFLDVNLTKIVTELDLPASAYRDPTGTINPKVEKDLFKIYGIYWIRDITNEEINYFGFIHAENQKFQFFYSNDIKNYGFNIRCIKKTTSVDSDSNITLPGPPNF